MNETPFIFYLCLDQNLTSAFYKFNATFKDLGYTLIPIQIDQLQTLAASTDQKDLIVLSSAQDMNEYRKHNLYVRKLLKYLLKSKRITFFQLSSFSKLNDTPFYHLSKNYFFMKYPLDARALSERIVSYLEMKTANSIRWPGGKLGATLSL